MKLNLEFDAGYTWKCTHGKHQYDHDAPLAVIGNKESGGQGSGLCLNHLYALEVMEWDTAFIPKAVTGTLRDAVIAEFYRVFPEPEPLVPCPVCGKQPTQASALHRYRCFHEGTPQSHFSVLCSISNHTTLSEARAAWNSMRREPVVSAADAPKTLGGYPCGYCIDAVKVGCTTATKHQLRAMLARIEQEKAKPEEKRYQVWRLTGADGPSVCDGGTYYDKKMAEQVLAVFRKRYGHEETYEVREVPA